MMMRSLLIALLVALCGCATIGGPPPQPNIYVMRHLHTPAGVSNAELTEEGLRFARLTSEWFRSDPPDVIYVSTTRRAQQTAEPLAQRLHLTPKLYDPADTAGVVAAVLKESGTVLVVGHSNPVPDIVTGLGGERPPPLVHEDFGDIWHVSGPARVTVRSRLQE
jgi:phosphohistidine phosphatase SixA